METIRERFTREQIIAIYELFERLNSCNTDPLSSCKVTGVATYVDANGNFICTYVMESWGGGDGKQIDIEYRQINPMGETQDMMNLYSSEERLIESISKMEKTTL
jgi:hypothetical protein